MRSVEAWVVAPPPPLHGLGSLVILVVDLPRVDQDSRGVEPVPTQSQSHSIILVGHNLYTENMKKSKQNRNSFLN